MNPFSHPSEGFSFDDASQDAQLTLTASNQEVSSTFTPFIDTERVSLIWGTNINVQEVSEKFKENVRGRRALVGLLEDMNITSNYVFSFDAQLLESSLFDQLVTYPQEIIPIFENSLQEIYMELYPNSSADIKFRPYNLGIELNIRNMDPKCIDKVIKVSGMVVRSSGIIPEVSKASFTCNQCKISIFVDSIKGFINEPANCECGGKYSFKINHNLGEYTDKQLVKLQELPDSVPDGSTPMTVNIISKDDNVDRLIPGDTVEIAGILRAMPVRVNPNYKKVLSSFRVFVELISAKVIKENRDENDYLNDVLKLSTNKNVYEILSRSIAPSIYGMDDVKKALLLQLCGGVSKEMGKTRTRGDINILLAGDPGISKSQLLCFVHNIAERGMYTSGRGSSAVGLTASVSRDTDTGQFILESGALVLSDGGVCCIDEFDKMNDSTRSVLHEVMEQQTVSVAKAGIVRTLNARAAVLASCNPNDSTYNERKCIVDNINLPPTLLSRFDIICLLIDKPDEIADKRIGDHIFNLFTNTDESADNDKYVVSIELFRAYIKEAKKYAPKLTPESIEALSHAYVNLRALGGGETVACTTRQLESLIRLSEAHAKVRFSETVDILDVNEADRIIRENLLMYAVDPNTGKIDMDMIISGKTASKSRLLDDLKESIKKLVKSKISIKELLEKTGADEKLMNEALADLEREEEVYVHRLNGEVVSFK